jgi:hypothetical protein
VNAGTWMSLVQTYSATVLTLLGAAWGYSLTRRQREGKARCELTHKVTHHASGDGRTVIGVDITVRNTGRRLLTFGESYTQLRRVAPIQAGDADAATPHSGQAQLVNSWPLLFHLDDPESASARLEPTECEAWHYDFVISGAITVVSIHTYIDNPAEALGWRATTLYETSGSTGEGEKRDACWTAEIR